MSVIQVSDRQIPDVLVKTMVSRWSGVWSFTLYPYFGDKCLMTSVMSTAYSQPVIVQYVLLAAQRNSKLSHERALIPTFSYHPSSKHRAEGLEKRWGQYRKVHSVASCRRTWTCCYTVVQGRYISPWWMYTCTGWWKWSNCKTGRLQKNRLWW